MISLPILIFFFLLCIFFSPLMSLFVLFLVAGLCPFMICLMLDIYLSEALCYFSPISVPCLVLFFSWQELNSILPSSLAQAVLFHCANYRLLFLLHGLIALGAVSGMVGYFLVLLPCVCILSWRLAVVCS